MKNLSLRLTKVASYVTKGSFVADVGADHGALSIYLVNNGIAAFVEAIENKRGPFLRLKKAVEENAIEQDKILLSFSSGLNDLDLRVNEIVIAGMGGRLIASILEDGKDKLKNVDSLILDAHSEWDIVLKATAELGYKVVEESFFYEDDIAYSVWKLVKTNERIFYSRAELLYGPLECHRRGEDWKRFMKEKRYQYEKILSGDLPETRRKEIEDDLRLLEEVSL